MADIQTALSDKITELKQRRVRYFDMARAFCDSQDSHGVMDAGAELQSIERAIKEFELLAVRYG